MTLYRVILEHLESNLNCISLLKSNHYIMKYRVLNTSDGTKYNYSSQKAKGIGNKIKTNKLIVLFWSICYFLGYLAPEAPSYVRRILHLMILCRS